MTLSRNKRTIHNSIVDIDDVFIGCGDAYENWIGIAKHKLWHREVALLRQRREASDAIIVKMTNMFISNQCNFDVADLKKMKTTVTRIYQQQLQSQIMDGNSPLIVRYTRSIRDALTKWKGYHPKDETIDMDFRQYFQQCRAWLDRNKTKMMARNLWIPMMRSIEEVSRKAAFAIFHQQASRLQTVYADYLKTWIWLGLVEHQIKPNNCAHRLLIPATVYDTFYKEGYPNLAIQPIYDPSKKAARRMCYLRSIQRKNESLRRAFDDELSTFYMQRVSASGSKAQQSDDVFMSCTHNQDTRLNGPRSGMSITCSGFQLNDHCSYQTPPQLPPLFPLNQSPNWSAVSTQRATPVESNMGGTYSAFPWMRNSETRPPPPPPPQRAQTPQRPAAQGQDTYVILIV